MSIEITDIVVSEEWKDGKPVGVDLFFPRPGELALLEKAPATVRLAVSSEQTIESDAATLYIHFDVAGDPALPIARIGLSYGALGRLIAALQAVSQFGSELRD